jgi:hypothetical protein
MLPAPHDTHLGKCLCRDKGLEEPEDPSEDTWNVYEEFPGLVRGKQRWLRSKKMNNKENELGSVETYEKLRIMILEDTTRFRSGVLGICISACYADSMVIYIPTKAH